MKINVTYGQLFNIRKDILEQMKVHPSFEFFNREKIKKFYNENGSRLEAIDAIMKDCMESHIEKDEHGRYKFDDSLNAWIYKSNTDKELAESKMKALLSKECFMVV